MLTRRHVLARCALLLLSCSISHSLSTHAATRKRDFQIFLIDSRPSKLICAITTPPNKCKYLIVQIHAYACTRSWWNSAPNAYNQCRSSFDQSSMSSAIITLWIEWNSLDAFSRGLLLQWLKLNRSLADVIDFIRARFNFQYFLSLRSVHVYVQCVIMIINSISSDPPLSLHTNPIPLMYARLDGF